MEVRNAWAAYDAMDSYDPYSVQEFLRAHRLLTKGLIAEAGVFRSKDVEIVNAIGEALHTGSRVEKVPRLMAETLEWARTTNAHPLVASSATHFLIEHIHPFADGNGRIGRLWQTLLLSKWNPLFAWMPTETLIAKNQLGYYTALQDSREPELDAAPFIGYMLGIIEASLINYDTNVVKTVVDDVVVNDRVLSMLRDSPNVTAAKLADATGLSPRQVQRIIRMWREQGRLVRKGSARAGRWVVRDE
ncbi:MAG: Fic family protein [Promicromonosporaceae bacterium]|nr:Fic family protein [Promicromonosporaceae bacterium]